MAGRLAPVAPCCPSLQLSGGCRKDKAEITNQDRFFSLWSGGSGKKPLNTQRSPFQRLFSLGNVSAFSRRASLRAGVRRAAAGAVLTAGVPVLPLLRRAPAVRCLLLPTRHRCSGCGSSCETSPARTGWERGWGEHGSPPYHLAGTEIRTRLMPKGKGRHKEEPVPDRQQEPGASRLRCPCESAPKNQASKTKYREVLYTPPHRQK